MNMSYININEIKARFSEYAKKVMQGKSFTIAIRNVPFAVLCPLPEARFKKKLRFGLMQDKFTIPEDFNAPLTDIEVEYYR